ncbi:hypothetical protein RJ640_017824 [Escallonia rubra]|uniref:Uncharacterized protein n=1 Tax=Escallonia rubra TaxID=112253 RepID=A0AA88RQG4_9ASTE|nr:hypothetical protein RJ640_017824 [Escallonia rubra]
MAHSRPYFSLRRSLTVEYSNVGNDWMMEGSSPGFWSPAVAGLMGVPEGLCRRCHEYIMFRMKHLQKYMEKKPTKKKTRRMTVRSMVTGGEEYDIGGGGDWVGSVDIAGKRETEFDCHQIAPSSPRADISLLQRAHKLSQEN